MTSDEVIKNLNEQLKTNDDLIKTLLNYIKLLEELKEFYKDFVEHPRKEEITK